MAVSRLGSAAKRRRRVRPEDEKRRIVAETYKRGASVSAVARRHDLNANLLFSKRRVMGPIVPASADEPTRFVPAVIGSEVEAASTPVPPPPGGAMEIVQVDGARVIVDRTVDGGGQACQSSASFAASWTRPPRPPQQLAPLRRESLKPAPFPPPLPRR